MRSRIVLIIVFMTISATSFGQVISGFKGKRVWAGVKMGAFPVPTSDGLVNGGVNLSLDYVMKNYVSFSAQLLYGSNHKPYKISDRVTSGLVSSSGTYHTNETGLDLGFKLYSKRRGALAPLGKHIDIGMRFKKVTLNYENVIINGMLGSGLVTNGEHVYNAMISYFGFGWEKVLSDKMLFHFGFITELDLAPFFESTEIGRAFIDDVHFMMINRNANYGLLRLNFGIKYAL